MLWWMSAEAPRGVMSAWRPCVCPRLENQQQAQSAGGHTVLSFFPESASITLVTHAGWPQHSFGRRSADRTPPPLTFLKSVSHLNIRGSLITLHFLPVLQFRQPAGYCDQLTVFLMMLVIWCIISAWQCWFVLFILFWIQPARADITVITAVGFVSEQQCWHKHAVQALLKRQIWMLLCPRTTGLCLSYLL